MEINSFRSEAHVAHKSRRDKLRIQQDPNPPNNGLSHYDNLQQIHAQDDGLSYSQLCSDMNMSSFPVNSQALMTLCNETVKRVVVSDPSFGVLPNHSSDPQSFSSSTWRSIGSQSIARGSDNNWLLANQGQIFHNCDNPMDSNVQQNMQCDPLPNQQNVRSFGLEVDLLKPKNNADREAEPRQVNWILGPTYNTTDQSFLEGGSNNQWNITDRDSSHRLVSANHDINNNTQGLCLTLSSVPSPKVHATQVSDHKAASSVANIPGNIAQHNTGPLGPFTGYAAILESSKFLRPAQQLLDEICCVACPINIETSSCDEFDHWNDAEVSGDVCFSSYKVDRLIDKTRQRGGASGSLDSSGSDNLQKKAKLIYIQEEVCKRYKHYQQQMQMVVSSFESVSALSAATPYISLALRTVSKHFCNLKNAITNQLKALKNNALGEDHLSSNAPKGQYHASPSMLKFCKNSFQKPKSGGSIGIIENQQVWRPQRGLPEHAVAVLRAWLFDHFLHPYPTDTDKHMLAAQTGLTRNQVSNWFINARVRVWKPMVEEVHMLETKAMSETLLNNPDKSNTLHATADPSRTDNNPDSPVNRPKTNSSQTTNLPNVDIWKNQEKRSRTEYDHQHSRRHHHPNVATCDNLDGSILANVVPNAHHSGVEIGGLGSISLTLGLRQSVENGQRHRENCMRQTCFGGQIVRDFVGQ